MISSGRFARRERTKNLVNVMGDGIVALRPRRNRQLFEA
jgi:hypothetical protein